MNWFTDHFSEDVWKTKYAGRYSDVRQYYKDLAEWVAMGDPALESRFFELMWLKRFSPGGRILALAGRPEARMSLMNCTTHEVTGDSLEEINDAVLAIMKASSRGQGIGIDISKLRPRGAPVNNAAKTSTGSISFMELFNAVGGTIGQEGRRAALLFSIDVSHPDLWVGEDKYDFLNVKTIPGKVESANISVKVTDDFMWAVHKEDDWTFQFTGTTGGKEFTVERTVKAKELFRELARCAWASGEPGLLYWDTSKRFSNSDLFGDRWGIKGVNACSEMVLDQDGVCNLGSINLSAYVDNPFTSEAVFDFAAFKKDVRTAIQFLDNIVSLEIAGGNYTSKEQYESLVYLRRVGLGVMGLADMLAKMGLAYDASLETMTFLDEVFFTMKVAAYLESIKLSFDKGPAEAWFDVDNWKKIANSGFYATLPVELRDSISRYGIRNVTVLSIAPTGTISNLLGVSSGVEPLFAHSYIRRTRMSGKDEFVNYVHPAIQEAREAGVENPERLWRTAYDVTPMEHISIQAVAQKHVDESIAKTLNFPSWATEDDIMNAYFMGWQAGLKGMAIYRDGSRSEQVLHAVSSNPSDECPSCGGTLVHKDGCTECPTCGYGKCAL